MEKAEVEKRVKKVVSKVLKVSEESIKADHKFTTDLGAESIQSLELIAGFEEEFDIEMDEDEAGAVETVEGAVEFIHKLVD